jgi:predicted RNase H-like HicB family nuclease
MRYSVVLEQEDDGGYVVSVPALPGCITQGDTREVALANVREAIEVHVEDCRDAGDPRAYRGARSLPKSRLPESSDGLQQG